MAEAGPAPYTRLRIGIGNDWAGFLGSATLWAGRPGPD